MSVKYRILKIPKRYCVTFLLFIINLIEGFVLGNMSLILTDITVYRKRVRGNETEFVKAEFDWTETEKSLLLGMNCIGVMTSCLSGMVVHKVGGVTFLGVSKLGEAFVTLSSPFVAHIHVHLFIALRFVLGVFEGLTFVGAMDVFARWAPPRERVRLLTFSTLGYSFGAAMNYPMSGFILQNFGWHVLFYIIGSILLCWSFVWILFVRNDPLSDRFITKKEKAYLSHEIKYLSNGKVVIPYKRIFTSVPVYALLNEFFISSFTLAFLSMLPLYIKDLYNTDIQTIGLISGIPEFAGLVFRPIVAYFADYIRSRPTGYSIGKIHKLFLFWGQFFTVILFFIAALLNNIVGCIVCFTLARLSYSVSQMSYFVIVIDVAGEYTGFLQSLVTIVKSTTFFTNPLLIALFIPNHTQSEWNVYFLFISFLTMYGVIMFVIFGSGDLQPWAEVTLIREIPNNTENDDKNKS